MNNRVCPKCGEEYSNTYTTCPFCEEDEAIRKGHPLRRQGGKRLEKQRRSNGGAGGVMLLLTAVIIAGAVAYALMGDQISETFGIRSDPEELGFINSGDEEDSQQETPLSESVMLPEASFSLSQSAMALAVGETALLTVIDGEGEVVWSSSDETIAVVENGAVTAKAGGSADIIATIGEESVRCSVEVEGEPPVEDTGSQLSDSTGATSSVKLTLNKTDFSIRAGDPAVQMKVNGTDSTVTWASKNSSVAKVSESGVVTRVGTGTTTITATVDGQVLECIVRCKS